MMFGDTSIGISAMLKTLPFILFLASLLPATDGQNKPPVCSQTYVTRSIIEGVPVGTTVLNFRDFCSDPENGPLTYQLNDNANQQFIVSGSNNLLKTNKPADAEAVLSYAKSFYASPWTLRVTLRDNGNGVCVFTVLVKIVSINDNPATIKNLVIPPVREDTHLGAIIGSCTLVDGDYPNSGHDIPYVEIIAGNEDQKFAVDYKTCDISLLDTLDYETKEYYTLTFRAYNFPNDTKATIKQQNILVLDVNDNSPACKSHNIIMDITEDKVTNDVLLKLDCWDVDSLNNGAIEFFSDTPGMNYPLQVDQTSGEITLTKDLDYDLDRANRHMDIAVRVTDRGSPPRSTTVTVASRVLDVDDQPPVFTQTMYSAAILETADLGHLALTVSATDTDTPHTALSKITFGLEAPCTQDWFLIDKDIGAILVKHHLDWETESAVNCLVYAYSSDKYEHRTFASVNITISDVNDRSPQFTQYLFEGRVVENSPAFTSVLTVTARDPEDGVNGQFSFSLVDDSPFAIDEATGLVYVNASRIVDYETAADYMLLVAASDKGTPSLTSLARISITVEPVNEFTPVFTNLSDIHVSELTWPGTLITTLHVQDGDAGSDGAVECSLQDLTSPFTLHKETGCLFAGPGLDYEVCQSYTLQVIVVDKSKTTARSSIGALNVFIINENESDPVCETVEPIVVTPRSHNIGDTIWQLNCTDLDLSTYLQFAILRGNSNMFDVNSRSGTVTFRTSPVEDSHLLVIGVSDQDKPVKMTEVFFQINVETPLKFTNLPIRISVSEDAAIKSLVYLVSAAGAYENLTYLIINGNHEGNFILHQTRGDVRLVRSLDRETTNSYAITIRATTVNGQTVEDDLIIDIDDTNDNCPMYDSSFDYIRVSESLPVLSTLKQYTAVDPDVLANSEIVYSILSGDPGDVFRYTSSGELQLLKQLNNEVQSLHALELCATDKGVPPLHSTMLVNVEVLKVYNNLKIVSSGGIVPLSLTEDVTIGSAIVKIQVENNNTWSDLTFTITSGNSGNNFTIDERTGEVYLIYALDRETAEVMTVGVKVSSSSGQTDTTLLVINITDFNDNNPLFNPDNNVFSAPHGTPVGSVIGTLFVTDSDAGVNKGVSLSITFGNTNNAFQLRGTTIVAASVLNANVDNHYELQVVASDHGTPSRNSTVNVSIFVQAELKVPEFSSPVDEITTEETCLPGSVLYDANATNRGATERSLNHSGDVVYSLRSGDADTFHVDPDNGKVHLIGNLNFALKRSHMLVITAKHNVNTSISDNLHLTVTVAQVNMHDPIFIVDMFMFNVSESAGVGSSVGQLAATDKDSGQCGQLSYSVESNDHFYVSPSTGVLTLIKPLEYSVSKSYNLLVKVTDNAGTRSRTAASAVSIHVIDTNNYHPAFTNTPYIVTVFESLPVGSVILVVAAEDLDSGVLGTVSYSIVSGNSDGLFALNSRNGVLALSSSLDFESSRRHILIIRGQDGGTPPLATTATVTVNVADENDNAPHFNETSTHLLIERDKPVMTRVFQASGSDKDTGNNAVVRYKIQDGNDDHLFSIDTLTGVLTTATSLAQANSYHRLIIAVIDQGLPHLSATMTISIALTPITKEDTGDYAFEVSENESVGTLVGSIANDPALHLISGYSIVGGNYKSAYTIMMNGNKQGILLTSIVLDRETCPYYKLHVAVEHAAGIKYIYIIVSVLDVNDNPPVFKPPTLEVYMVENLAPGNIVGALAVSDADQEGTNSQWDLSIAPPASIGSTHFTVAPLGTIKVAKSLSYEAWSVLRFYIVATDRGKPKLSTTATVVVIVVDVLETIKYKPLDTASYISREFPDDATEEDLCTLKASQAGLSAGPSDVLKFITVGSDSVFRVQASTNTLVVQRPSLIFALARYFQWVIVETTSAGITTARALLIRLDTFNKHQHMMTAVVDMDLAELRAKIETLRLELQAFYKPPQAVRIWKTQSTSQPGRRRLLNAGAEALFVVVADEAADDMPNVQTAKTFLSNTEAVTRLQSSADGTPVQELATSSLRVISVLPYAKWNITESSEDLDPAFVAIIVMGCLASVVLINCVIAVAVYRVCYHRSVKRDDKEGLVTSDDTESRKCSFQTIGHSDQGSSRASNDSSVSNMLREISVNNQCQSSSSTLGVTALTRSHSITGDQPSSRQRKITPVNEPGVDPTDFLEVPSKSPSNNSLQDDSRFVGSSKATSITVSSADESPRAASDRRLRKSSTMLESLEVDAFSSPDNVSRASPGR